jgi:hypothetical protein
LSRGFQIASTIGGLLQDAYQTLTSGLIYFGALKQFGTLFRFPRRLMIRRFENHDHR